MGTARNPHENHKAEQLLMRELRFLLNLERRLEQIRAEEVGIQFDLAYTELGRIQDACVDAQLRLGAVLASLGGTHHA